ncbi:hypothetical protein DAEQUDRAFT_810281 [Daedalea quercina L-15889]|uniref:DUF6533 domain-containing protein n=1 Tax=Daedalea quercina L-15889 TaxID=1314783 RepID=A0A165RQ65_9APHY|nr:hypothetical protein DAEQUDRAFT_810281 [Daedalea quercina L-15889]
MSSLSSELILELESSFVTYRCLLAAFTIYIFDHALTFASEVEYIWCRRKSGVILLYVTMHVCTLVMFVTNIAGWLDSTGCESAYALSMVDTAVLCALYVIWGVISASRAYALSGREWTIPTLIFIVSLVPVAANIAYCWGLAQENIPPPIGCVVYNKIPQTTETRFEIATRTCVIATDLLVLLVTWKATYGIRRNASALDVKTPIAVLLLRDGTIYFGVLLVINILSLALWVTNVLEAASTFSSALNTILFSRLFLNLREAAIAPGSTASTTSKSPNEHFTSLVFGNIGGSLAHGMDAHAESGTVQSMQDDEEALQITGVMDDEAT